MRGKGPAWRRPRDRRIWGTGWVELLPQYQCNQWQRLLMERSLPMKQNGTCPKASTLRKIKQRLFNTAPPAVVTPSHKIISVLLYNCNFATIIHCKVNVSWRQRLAKGVSTHRLRTTALSDLLRRNTWSPSVHRPHVQQLSLCCPSLPWSLLLACSHSASVPNRHLARLTRRLAY